MRHCRRLLAENSGQGKSAVEAAAIWRYLCEASRAGFERAANCLALSSSHCCETHFRQLASLKLHGIVDDCRDGLGGVAASGLPATRFLVVFGVGFCNPFDDTSGLRRLGHHRGPLNRGDDRTVDSRSRGLWTIGADGRDRTSAGWTIARSGHHGRSNPGEASA